MADETKSVALARQRGSGGSFVGRAVAERLALRYVDRDLLRQAAEFLQADQAQTSSAAMETWWSRLGQALALAGPDFGYAPPSLDAVYEETVSGVEERLIRECADRHRSVIVGRGAAQILRGRPDVLSVFLHAPEPWRAERLQRLYDVTPERAIALVRGSDRERARFAQSVGQTAWTDARAYDLTIDTAAVGLERAIELIVSAAGRPR